MLYIFKPLLQITMKETTQERKNASLAPIYRNRSKIYTAIAQDWPSTTLWRDLVCGETGIRASQWSWPVGRVSLKDDDNPRALLLHLRLSMDELSFFVQRTKIVARGLGKEIAAEDHVQRDRPARSVSLGGVWDGEVETWLSEACRASQTHLGVPSRSRGLTKEVSLSRQLTTPRGDMLPRRNVRDAEIDLRLGHQTLQDCRLQLASTGHDQ